MNRNGQKNRRLYISISLLVFLMLNLYFLDAEARSKRRHKRAKLNIVVNQILKLDGVLTRNGQPAPEFSGVKDGDVLETGERSVAIIRIPGLGLFRMGPQTKFRMTKFQGRDLTRLELLSGNLTVLFKRLGDHEMILPRGLIIPQGANFLASTNGKEVDDVVLCAGKIKVKAFNAADEEEKVEQVKKKPTATPAPSPSPSPAEGLITELVLTSSGDVKHVQFVDEGIQTKVSGEAKNCDTKLITDLESLYGLP
jgi:hypothetical protein